MNSKESLIRDITKELSEDNVAVFAGAGMSVGSGFVNWQELMRPIAEELGLDVEKEQDLITLAQYHYNVNGNNRSELNRRLIEEFSRETEETENHQILSRLPIQTYWTTNYDKIIEKALEKWGKVPDVKYTKSHLSQTKPRRNAIVYKMHGDIDHPNNAILTKDDYESYHIKMDQYLSSLKGDLLSKTFLFIGFSFSDPNLDYILSRVRVANDGDQRRHYCFLKTVSKDEKEDDADFQYRKRKQELFVDDLKRFNIKTVLVSSYDEITDILREIERRYKSKTVFISGAAHEYGDMGESAALKFVHRLSGELIRNNFKIISGFGLGIGSSVVSGALNELFLHQKTQLHDQLVMRPFPQEAADGSPLKELWKKYREDMLSHAGVAVFLFGNKLSEGEVLFSDGMREEFDIAVEKGVSVIPVGVTGYMANQLWKEVQKSLGGDDESENEEREVLEKLGISHADQDELVSSILNAIEFVSEKGGDNG